MIEHQVSQSRFSRGMTPIRPSRPVYGTAARCTCGASFRSNWAPSAGGARDVKAWFKDHVGAGVAAAAADFDKFAVKRLIIWVIDDGTSAAFAALFSRVRFVANRDARLAEIEATELASAGFAAVITGDLTTADRTARELFDRWPHGASSLELPSAVPMIRLQQCGTFHRDGEPCGFTLTPCSGNPAG